jgi:hypothetical protein
MFYSLPNDFGLGVQATYVPEYDASIRVFLFMRAKITLKNPYDYEVNSIAHSTGILES